MAYVECEVSPGLRESEVTVAVRDLEGAIAFLRVERDFVRSDGSRQFLPVGLVHRDEALRRVLIELPHEADSGVNRLWVGRGAVRFDGNLRTAGVA